jgi:hypothetical protein
LTALYEFGAKNLWTSELEEELASGQLDLIVHCLKGKWVATLIFERSAANLRRYANEIARELRACSNSTMG